MTPESLPPRPFSPFLRLLIGAGTTALLGEWARFQADLVWAALPIGAGSVITLASVARGVRERRRWRQAVAALASAQPAEGDSNDGPPVPSGREPSPLTADPDTVTARRRDPRASRPATIQRGSDRVDTDHDAHEHDTLEPTTLDARPDRRPDTSRETVSTARDRSEGGPE